MLKKKVKEKSISESRFSLSWGLKRERKQYQSLSSMYYDFHVIETFFILENEFSLLDGNTCYKKGRPNMLLFNLPQGLEQSLLSSEARTGVQDSG